MKRGNLPAAAVGLAALLLAGVTVSAAPGTPADGAAPVPGEAVASGPPGAGVAAPAPGPADAVPPPVAAPAPDESREADARPGPDAPPRERVEHHLKQARLLADDLEAVMRAPCPRFTSEAAWEAFLDRQVESVVLLAAHARQARSEARAAGDEDLRRAAREPRRHLDGARGLVAKLATCAQENGTALDLVSIARRVERDVPRRRAEIRLPPRE